MEEVKHNPYELGERTESEQILYKINNVFNNCLMNSAVLAMIVIAIYLIFK